MSINKIYNIQEWQQVLTVATPSASASIIYPKTDGNWYYMNSDGIEKISTLSYNVGNGLTSSTASGVYNYNISVDIDGNSLTFSGTKIKVGYLTASVFTQLGPATASYIMSVNSSGTPIWIPYSSQGINGTAGYIPKFNDVNSITNSNIFDGGTYISLFTASNSFSNPNLFINGSIDATTYYINSNQTANINITSIVSSGNNILKFTTPNFFFTDISNNNLISASGSSNGYSLNLLNVLRVTGTTSTNATSSVILPNVNLVGIGTASPTNLFTIFATNSAAFRLVDGSQGNGKYLISDANGVASWANIVVSGSVSLLFATNPGLTVSNFQYSVLLSPNSGLTLSSTGLSINPSAAGYGLTFGGGSFSVSGNFGINTGSGLTNSGTTYSVNLGINSGLTFSGTTVIIQVGSGLTLSNGSLASTGLVSNGVTNSLPYFNTASSLTSSVIYQINNNILIGTVSDIGAKLYVNGSVSIISDAIVNSVRVGRGSGAGNLVYGLNTFGGVVTPGTYNIAIGDNSFYSNTSGTNSIAIGLNSLYALNSGNENVVIGNYSVLTGNPNKTVAIGYRVSTFIGDESVIIGAQSGFGGSKNISIGFQSGGYVVSSQTSQNVFLGYKAGSNFNGSYSVFIGGYDNSLSTSNNIFISDGEGNLRLYVPSTGNLLIGTMSDNGYKLQVVGSASFTGNILIATTSNDGARLVVGGSASIYGKLKIADSTQAANRILVSDSNGVASWTSSFSLLGGTFFAQGGNTFGATAILGTNDNYNLQIVAGGTLSTIFSTNSISFYRDIYVRGNNYISGAIAVGLGTSSAQTPGTFSIIAATNSNGAGTSIIISAASGILSSAGDGWNRPGGSLTLMAGDAAGNSGQGSSNASDVTIQAGKGASGTVAGSVNIQAGSTGMQSGNSGNINITSGAQSYGSINIAVGQPNTAGSGAQYPSGNISISSGIGHVVSSGNSNPGGAIIMRTGAVQTLSGGATGGVVGAAAGTYSVITGLGAAFSGTSLAGCIAGNGGVYSILTGNGGSVTGPGSTGGNGGFVLYTLGNSGFGSSASGIAGYFRIIQSLTASDTTAMLQLNPTWNTTGAATAVRLNVTDTLSATTSLFLDLQKSGVSQFNVDKNGNTTVRGSLILNSTITDISGLTGPNNYVLSATAGGVKWVISAPNNVVKYSGTQSFTANLASVISHNLNSMFYIIQLFDYTTGEEILGSYTNRGLTQATITLTTDVSNCGVVILG